MKKKVALIFPGQGAQDVGMGLEFYENSKEAKHIFDSADQVIEGLSDIIFKGPQETLTSTLYCQPAIFTYSMAVYAAFKVHQTFQNIEPVFTCGLSLGEYSALCSANVLSFEDTLKLVQQRSHLMNIACEKSKGAMAAVIGFDENIILEVCQQTGIQVANFNSPAQIVITGEEEKVKKASSILTERGAKRVMALDVAGAFHSELMASAVPDFEKCVQRVDFKDAKFSVLSNVDACATQDAEYVKGNLSKQITSSVQWVKSIEVIVEQGVTDFIEIGPGTVLKGLLRKINRDLKVQNIQTPSDLDKLIF